MTSTTGRDPHPEIAEISALTEGILPPGRGAAVRDHIAGCAVCAEVLSSLEEIREMLGTLPGPQRMPADVAERIDAALAAEALLDATAPDVPRGTSAGSTRSGSTRSDFARPGSTLADSAAGDSTSAEPAAGPTVPRGTSAAPAGRPAATTGPGRADDRRPGRNRNSRRWRRGLLATASGAAVVAMGFLISQAGDGSTNRDSGMSAQKKAETASGQGDPVAAEVSRLLSPTVDQAPPAAPGTSTGNTPMLSGRGHTSVAGPGGATTSVPSCVLAGTGRTDRPLAAEPSTYQGTGAYLVVLPHGGDGAQVDAFMVNASCTETAPGAVLFQHSYPRP